MVVCILQVPLLIYVQQFIKTDFATQYTKYQHIRRPRISHRQPHLPFQMLLVTESQNIRRVSTPAIWESLRNISILFNNRRLFYKHSCGLPSATSSVDVEGRDGVAQPCILLK